ncbi:MAG: hypothetical protein ACREC0_06750 [Methylocella sp.]
MTKLLGRAVATAVGLPPDTQDKIARLVLQLAGNEEPPVALTAGERAAIDSKRRIVGASSTVSTGPPALSSARIAGIRLRPTSARSRLQS